MNVAVKEIVCFVKKELEGCFDNVQYNGEWHGYEVYTPFRNDGERMCIGGPFVVLVQDGKIRMATEDEALAFIDEHYPEEAEETVLA